jgi:predicted GIY-YIG superfamily endonuclease
MNGSVYIIKAHGQNAYKIGITTAKISDRIAALQTGCPYKIVYVFHSQVENEQALEAKLHKHFKGQKMQGEWFNLYPEQVVETIQIIQRIQRESAMKRVYAEIIPAKKQDKRVINPEACSLTDFPYIDYKPLTALPEQGVLIKLLEGFKGSLACFIAQILKIEDDNYGPLPYMRTIACFVKAIDRIDLWEQLQMSRYYRFDDLNTPYIAE